MTARTTRSLAGPALAPSLSPVLAAIAFLAAVGPADATIQDWVIVGEVLTRNGPIFTGGCAPSATVGSTVRVDYAFDDAAADLVPADPTWGGYASVGDWRVRFAGPADQVAGPQGVVEVFDDRDISGILFQDRYYVVLNGTLTDIPTGCVEAGATGGQIELELYEEAFAPSSAMTSDAQPVTPPSVAAFTTIRELRVVSDSSWISISVTDLYVLGSASAPILPDAALVLPGGGVMWGFTTSCTTGCWVDPPFADGFVYETDGGSLFTSIDDFPSGFGAPFEVWVDGSMLGTFGPGQSVDFSGYPGGGVGHFSVRGITPGVDVEDQQAFPLQLSLDTSPATFTMTSLGTSDVPMLPGFGWSALAGALALTGSVLARRRASNRSD